MKLALLSTCLLAACSVSAAPSSEKHVRYTVSFAGAAEPALQRVVDVYEQRLGKSAGDATFRTDAQAGTIRVEFPFGVAFREDPPARALQEALPADAHALAFTTDERVPVRGLACIDDEWLRYDDLGGARGLFGTPIAAHAAGAKLHVYEDDLVRSLLGSRGEVEFLERATEELLAAHDTTEAAERERFAAWRQAHAGARLKEFDGVARAQGGPLSGTLWRRFRDQSEHAGAALPFALLVRAAEARSRFGNPDIAKTGYSQDSFGYPAVSFELSKERQKEFADWTESLIGKGLAVVLDDEILMLATVRSRLPGSGILAGGSGGFSRGEVEALVQLLRQPLLPLAPRSLATEFIP